VFKKTGVWFIQVELAKIPMLGLYLKFTLYRILFYSGFSIDRFHCINKQNIAHSFLYLV